MSHPPFPPCHASASMQDPATAGPARPRRGPLPPHPALRCPRCDSHDTKFCYFNNYNLSQPRHFCKSCRRYWTRGGALRNIPVGGASRKSKRSDSAPAPKPPRPKSRRISEESRPPRSAEPASAAPAADHPAAPAEGPPDPFLDHPATFDLPQLWPGFGLLDADQIGGTHWPDLQWMECDPYLFLP